MPAYPEWLHALAWIYFVLCFVCAAGIGIDELRRPQKMWIMNLVWPITALYLGPGAVWLYLRTLPETVERGAERSSSSTHSTHKSGSNSPDWIQNSVAVFHCGAGCTLGDLIGETSVPALGLVFAGEFRSKVIVDFLLAYLLGIAFQYFTIVPMRGLSFGKGLKAAVRADTISITLFEVGMFGWMALSYFVFFPSPHLKPSQPVFWFMMQIAMIAGSLTSYPANFWLIKKGWKEKMPHHKNKEGGDLPESLKAA